MERRAEMGNEAWLCAMRLSSEEVPAKRNRAVAKKKTGQVSAHVRLQET